MRLERRRLTELQPITLMAVFLADSYDISALAGGEFPIVRFSYATDPGLARPGWFIDDLKVTVTDGGETSVIYATDFEEEEHLRLYPGGCTAHGAVAEGCTDGWQYVSAELGSPADHAYYLEMRSRTGFDFDGKGENDRDPNRLPPRFAARLHRRKPRLRQHRF